MHIVEPQMSSRPVFTSGGIRFSPAGERFVVSQTGSELKARVRRTEPRRVPGGGLLLLVLLCVPLSAQSPPRSSTATAQFQLWLSTTEALIEARDLATLFDITGTGEVIRRELSANGLAVAKLHAALRALRETSASAGSSPQQALRMPVAALHALFDQHLGLLHKRELQLDRPEVMGQLNADLIRVQAQIRDRWKTWLDVTRGFSNAFTGPRPAGDGSSQQLYITDADRQRMVERLQKRFPTASNAMSGAHPLESSVGLMMQALQQ